MSDTLLRQWAMLRHIPRHPRKIDCATLKARLAADGYDISVRSIQRDLIKLEGALPLLGDDAKPTGWSWQPQAPQLDLPALDPHAALTFKLVEAHLTKVLPASTLSYLAPWFRNAAGVLDTHQNGLSRWPDKIRVISSGPPLSAPIVDAEAQTLIYRAILEERQLELAYQPRGADDEKTYRVHPLALVVKDQIIYLLTTMWDYGEIRQLALHRVRTATMLDEAAVRPSDFNLDAYISKGAFGYKCSTTAIHIVAAFSQDAAVHLVECPLSDDQILTKTSESEVQVSATVQDTAELRWWLLGYGDKVQVISPKFLREEFRAVGNNLGKIYASHEL